MDIKRILVLLGFYFPIIVAIGLWIAKKDGMRKWFDQRTGFRDSDHWINRIFLSPKNFSTEPKIFSVAKNFFFGGGYFFSGAQNFFWRKNFY